jgi:predicted lipoprotein with Yx(FWY)xxD motif
MRNVFTIAGALLLFTASPGSAFADFDPAGAGLKTETYVAEPLPPGFSVRATELEGPVFADERGMTLYVWPFRAMRVGTTGDSQNMSACLDEVTTETAGMMSPYPAGLKLPEVETRLSCTQVWPPAYAKDDAKPVGNFTIIARADGKKQWAHNKRALYTSHLDTQPGDAFGATTRDPPGDGPAVRKPVGPAANVPPGFIVMTTARGRMILNDKNYSVYTSDRDGAEKSNCTDACARTWVPIIASAMAVAQGEWTTFERSPGVRQWAFRKKPVYTYARDIRTWSQQGSDQPGWHNVFTQVSPPPPKGFGVMDNEVGEVIVSPEGKTVYTYTCGDDSKDQLACDHPGTPQAYRFAICGGGKVERCLRRWPYIPAADGVTSTSRTWSVVTVDPNTGRHAKAGQPGALNVWAYRGRPVFTFEGDTEPGNINGNRTGEFNAKRNGFNAFILRDDFFDGDV